MSHKPERYRLSFTFGGLLVPETLTVAEAYMVNPDWTAVRKEMVDRNGLHKTRSSSSNRYFREIRDRLTIAYSWELKVIAAGVGTYTPDDIATTIFVVFARYYRLVGDFITQVVRHRLQTGLPTIDEAMFRTFMADQSPVHPELASISDTTRDKLVSVAMRALREGGVFSGNKAPYVVTAPSLSPALRDRYCVAGTAEDLTRLLWTDEEIRPCLT